MASGVQTEFGHSLPPEGPHTVTFHMPGWEVASMFHNEVDLRPVIARLKSIYPRIFPLGLDASVSAVHEAI
jgi:cystathionine gamma-synthase